VKNRARRIPYFFDGYPHRAGYLLLRYRSLLKHARSPIARASTFRIRARAARALAATIVLPCCCGFDRDLHFCRAAGQGFLRGLLLR
jgi:hypothetical protein